MEENKLVPMGPTEIVLKELPREVTVEKSKRKIRKRRRRVWILPLLLLIALTAVLIIRYNENIQGYIQSVFNDEENEAISDKNNTQRVPSDDKTVDTNDAFIHTSPTKMEFINESNRQIDLNALSYDLPKATNIYDSYSKESPVVLIVSFSPKECYTTSSNYNESTDFYSGTKNVGEIGKALCEELNKNGINTLHFIDTGYNGSLVYSKEMYVNAINDILKSNPSISYIIDVSRGVDLDSNMNMHKEAVDVAGEYVPTVGLIYGGENEMLEKSVFFGNSLASTLNKSYTLVSKQTVSKYGLFQSFGIPSIRADIGSFSCTYEEALTSAMLFAQGLTELIK